MRYSPRQYAAALLKVLNERKILDKKEVVRGLLSTIVKRGDQKFLGLVLREVEKQYLRNKKIKKIELESASAVSRGVKKDIRDALGGEILFQEKINPRILAGVRIIVDGELLIDASAKTQLDKIFN